MHRLTDATTHCASQCQTFIARFKESLQAGLGILAIFAVLLLSSFPFLSISDAYAEEVVTGNASSHLPLHANAQDALLKSQMLKLDAEIQLLKAELARKNGEAALVNSLLESIPTELLSKPDKARYDELKRYVELKTKEEATAVAEPNTSPFQVDLTQPLVLLPLSGPYATIGQAILDGLQSELPNTLKVVDTALFDTPSDLWSLVTLMQPSFIIGPLRPQWANVLYGLNHTTPMLSFNPPNLGASPNPLVKILAPQWQDRLWVLRRFLQTQSIQRYGMLYTQTGAEILDKIPLPQDFRKEGRFERIGNNVDGAVNRLLGVQNSVIRTRWLERILQRRVEFESRARQDLGALVLWGAMEMGVQGRPLLNFYHLDYLDYVWMPDEMPSVEALKRQLAQWQRSYAILPAFFPVQQLTESKGEKKREENSGDGTFYALGKTTVKILPYLTQDKQGSNVKQTEKWLKMPVGWIRLDEKNDIHLMPHLVWLDQGSMTRLDIIMLQDMTE